MGVAILGHFQNIHCSTTDDLLSNAVQVFSMSTPNSGTVDKILQLNIDIPVSNGMPRIIIEKYSVSKYVYSSGGTHEIRRNDLRIATLPAYTLNSTIVDGIEVFLYFHRISNVHAMPGSYLDYPNMDCFIASYAALNRESNITININKNDNLPLTQVPYHITYSISGNMKLWCPALDVFALW